MLKIPGKYNTILAIFLILTVTSRINAFEANYYSINKIISKYKLEVEYNAIKSSLKIKKNDKYVILILNSPYTFIEDNKYFINNYIISKKGEFFITNELTEILKSYFSFDKNNSSVIASKNGDEYFFNIKDSNISNNTKPEEVVTIDDEEEIIEDKVVIKDRYIYDKEPDEIKINAIIIDPGHGGVDPGAVGYSGSKEKDIVLKTALLLKDKLKTLYPDKKIVLTRDKDVFPPLEKRSQIANYVFNKYGASLFISIHVNASRSSKPYGFETWYLVEEYKRDIVKKAELSIDSDVANVLNSMLNDEIHKESKELASLIQSNLEKQIGYVSANRGIKEQTYFVIKKSTMPAVLVEIGFNTNKYEEIRLTKYSYLTKIVTGIFEGVKKFIQEYEKTSAYTK